MRNLLLALVLLGTPASPAGADTPPDPPLTAVGIVVESGRVLHMRTPDYGELLRRGSHAFEGPVELELGTGAVADVRFGGSMSLRVEGPARLSWAGFNPAQPPCVRVERAGRIEWESRQRDAELVLSQGWRLLAGRGATRLEAVPGGEVDLSHHGGDDLRIKTTARRPAGSWPSILRPGKRARLTRHP